MMENLGSDEIKKKSGQKIGRADMDYGVTELNSSSVDTD